MLPLRATDPYANNAQQLKKEQQKREKLVGAAVLGAVCAVASRIYVADRVCGYADTPERYDCVSYVFTTWGLIGGIVGRKTAPYVFEGCRKIYQYSCSFFPAQ